MKEIKGSAVLIVLTLALVCFFGGFLLGSSRTGTQVQVLTEKSATLAPSIAPASTEQAREDEPEPEGEVTFPVNINTAGKKALMELPGIGETYAQRIIDHREKHGPFTEIEGIMEVSGIGEKRFENIKDYITVEEQNEDTGS